MKLFEKSFIKNFNKSIKGIKIGRLCSIPLVLLCAGMILFPLLMVFSYSLMRRGDVSALLGGHGGIRSLFPPVISLEQYYGVLIEQSQYLNMFFNSLWLTGLIAFFHTGLALLGGYVLAKVPFPGRGALFFAYALLMVMPLEVSLLPVYMMSRSLGIYNSWWAIILPGIFAPLGVFMMRQFILSVPDELCEGMRLESSSSLMMLWHVIAPCVKSGIVTLFVVTFAENWNMVEQPLILLSDPRKYPLSLALNRLEGIPRDMVFAAAVVFLLPTGILYLLLKEQILDGLGGIIK